MGMIFFELLVSQILLSNTFFSPTAGYNSQVFDFLVGIAGGLVAYIVLAGKAIRKKQSYLPDWVLTFFHLLFLLFYGSGVTSINIMLVLIRLN